MKTKSKAYLKVEQERDLHNVGKTKITAKDLSCVVYLGVNKNNYSCFRGYSGRSLKPTKNHYYNSVEQRDNAVAEFMSACMARANYNKPKKRQLVVGDVLSASWGYDQTNVNYYLVINLVGKSSVDLVEIGKDSNENLLMQGKAIPDINAIKSEPMRKKVDGVTVRINSSIRASKKTPLDFKNGVKVWGADNFTTYG